MNVKRPLHRLAVGGFYYVFEVTYSVYKYAPNGKSACTCELFKRYTVKGKIADHSVTSRSREYAALAGLVDGKTSVISERSG